MSDISSNRKQGTVKWFNNQKGFGFIEIPGQPDVFVHYREINGQGHKTLAEGQKVSFKVVHTDKGQQAEDVVVED